MQDDAEILRVTLSNTIQRFSKIIANYEIEIANMTSEIIKLNSMIDEQENTMVE